MNNFLLKIAENDLQSIFHNMRYDDSALIKFQKRRLIKSLMFIVISLCLSFFYSFFILIGIGLAVFQWVTEYKRVKKVYTNYLFQKQLTFSKFARMLIPYLLQSNATLYTVFNRMLTRLEDGHVKHCLERLIIEMNEQPNSEEPFVRFALDASSSDSAVLFMTTLYDYQQHTFDHSILTELGKLASEELFYGVDEIIDFKLRKFNMFPTKMTMLNLIIVAGYMIAMFTNLAKEIFQ